MLPPVRFSLTCLLVLLAAGLPNPTAANFAEGEFVPTARRAQYQQKRTHWHDLLGRHCPRFGIDKVVAVPIPRPVDLDTRGDSKSFEYKISLAFDGERHHTPWLTIIKSGKNMPLIQVELTRSGTELRSVKATVTTAPKSVIDAHRNIDAEFQDINMWPKHLLVQYRWTTINEVDVDLGLYVLFGSGLLMSAMVAFSVVRTYQAKLSQFLSDMAAEEFTPDVHSVTAGGRATTGGFQPGKAD